jgi:hypothetical protein
LELNSTYFWSVRLSQGLEYSALATSPCDKTQEFRHQSWDPGGRAKIQVGVGNSPEKFDKLEELEELEVLK